MGLLRRPLLLLLGGLSAARAQAPAVTLAAEWDCRNSSAPPCTSLMPGSLCSPGGTCSCPAATVRGPAGCIPAAALGSPCSLDSQCHHSEPAARCIQAQCRCTAGFHRTGNMCVEDEDNEAKSVYTVPTSVGLGLGLSLLTAFLCFTLKLFSKARTVETRGYGDASIPPTITVEGKDLVQDEENWSRASSKSRIYTPGAPLTPSQVRRMSELSTVSVTVQDKDFTVRPVSPGPSVHGSTDPLCRGSQSVEQSLTIIPRLGPARRKSIADYAFPELHQKGLRPGGDSSALLILTRTRTDGQGRRHSVAVPLLAPPGGPASAGNGIQIERRLSPGAAPARAGLGRRHSLQAGPAARPPSRSPSRRGSRRARRPSRQGLYQFLDQAISH